ncbi:MAG: sulfite exporter TauE/SafE family protein [Thiohalocapsa sp.]
MSASLLICLGLLAGAGAGFLAGLIGIGGGIVIVPVVYYGLVTSGVSANEAAHIAVSTSLAAIVPTAIVSSIAHWRAGNTDFAFLRDWGPGIVLGVIVAQLMAPHLRGSLLTGVFALFCLAVAARFALPGVFKPLLAEPPGGRFTHVAGAGIGIVSGLAGVGGGILTNVVMTLSGVSMHKSIGRAAAAGLVVSIPATIVALGQAVCSDSGACSISLPMWVCIAPAQATAAWIGAQLAQRITADQLSRVFGGALAATGAVMLQSRVGWPW